MLGSPAWPRDHAAIGHFRTEYQTEDGEAKRNDEKYCFASVWEYQKDKSPTLHQEPLKYETVHLATRSYK
jgi:succinate dehydrogenase / fumarate reductase flavoprotein subunit